MLRPLREVPGAYTTRMTRECSTLDGIVLVYQALPSAAYGDHDDSQPSDDSNQLVLTPAARRNRRIEGGVGFPKPFYY